MVFVPWLCLRMALIVCGAAALGVVVAAAPDDERIASTVANTSRTPYRAHVDRTTGAVFFTEEHSLRRIDANGTIEVIAGSNVKGNNDGVGSAASFDTPNGVAVGVEDHLVAYLVDQFNSCIRRVDLATRNVSTFAGLCGSFGTTNSIGKAARFYYPVGIALFHDTASGLDVFLYVADRFSHRIRRIEIASANVTTFAGITSSAGNDNGPREQTARFYWPFDVAVDATGRWVYVADSYNSCIRKIDARGSNGNVTTLAGQCSTDTGFVDGLAGAARFSKPTGIVVDSSGSVVFVADEINCAIRRINATDGNVTTVTSRDGCVGATVVNGPLATARFKYPQGLSYDVRTVAAGRSMVEHGLVVADYGNYAIRRLVLGFVRPTASGSPTITHQLPVTATPTMSCGVDMTLHPNETTTNALAVVAGAQTTITLVDRGSSFEASWCARFAVSARNATAGVITTFSQSVLVLGVSAAYQPGGRCNAVTVALHKTSDTPRRGTFDIPLHLTPQAFGCYVVGGRSMSMLARYEPITLIPPAVKDATEIAVVAVALPVSSLGGAGVTATMQRALLQLKLASCDFDLSDELDVASNPLQVAFGHAEGQHLRGAVVGNIAVMAIIASLAIVAVGFRRHTARRQGREMTLWRAGASLALPGWLVGPLAALLQPLVSSSVALVVNGGAMAGDADVTLGAFGLLTAAVCVAASTFVVTRGFAAVGTPRQERVASTSGNACLGVVISHVEPRFAWHDVRSDGSLFTKHFGSLFEGYTPRRHWFIAVELWAAVAAGAMGGVVPMDGGTCAGLLVAMEGLNVVMLVAICVLRPYNARMELVLATMTVTTATTCGAAALAGRLTLAAVMAVVEVWLGVVALLLLVLQLMLTRRVEGALVRCFDLVGSMGRANAQKVATCRNDKSVTCDVKWTGKERQKPPALAQHGPTSNSRPTPLAAGHRLRSHGVSLAQHLVAHGTDAVTVEGRLEQLVLLAAIAGRQKFLLRHQAKRTNRSM